MTPQIPSAEQRRRDQLIGETATVQIGRFQAPVESPLFRAIAPPGHFVVVFPNTTVAIQPTDGERFVTDRNRLVFHNKDDRYTREALDPRGDFCHWLSAGENVLRETVATWKRLSPPPGGHPSRLFAYKLGPCSAPTFALARSLFQHLEELQSTAQQPDPLLIDEVVLELLDTAISAAEADHRRWAGSGQRCSPSRWLVTRAQEFLATQFTERPGIEEVARAVGCSPYHLCRAFRMRTGTTLHRWRMELALRAAFDEMMANDRRITDIAADYGFSSHSHLTSLFRRRFGIRPSVLRSQRGRSRVAGIRTLCDTPQASN